VSWIGRVREGKEAIAMANELKGKRIAFLATDGFEQIEFTEPWDVAKKAGAQVELLAPISGEILGLNHIDKGKTFKVDLEVSKANPNDYDGLVLPGGVVNADALRMDRSAMSFVRNYFASGKPLAVICHGPWALVETGQVKGKTLTSWPSLRTDIQNAGGTWVDAEVHVDEGLVTSRKPADLKAFCAKMIEEFVEGKHATRAA
jgi:protease I